MLTIGSLCTGYGGLDIAVAEVFGARTVWVSEIDPYASRVLARHWPHAPDLGDITAIDWAAVPPVDILIGGTPCQDLSVAGRRAGMTAHTRSGLWSYMRDAIAAINPRFVVWENVYGALSASAASDVECCPGCVGDLPGRPALRALGRVLGDLAGLGFDAEWRSLRASDVGACHQRRRVFVVAWRRDSTDADSESWHPWRIAAPRETGRPRGRAGGRDRASLAGELGDVWRRTPYGDAILRHQQAVGRPAPHPTVGVPWGRALAPEFVEMKTINGLDRAITTFSRVLRDRLGELACMPDDGMES